MAINSLTAGGLTIQQQPDIVAELTTGYTSIYGADINLGPNTPDGQMMNIYATALEDNLELLQSVYNMFNLINAYGVQLDNMGQLLGLIRQAGTYTQAQVLVTVSQAVTLPGQDVLVSNPSATVFTVADEAGNQYQLVASHVFSGAGSATLTFAAVDIGQILTSANTITAILTPLLGVTSVNNPSTSSDVLGTNEETDSAFRVRMAQSFQLAAVGPADALRAALLNVPGILDAYVPENDTGGIVDGVFSTGIMTVVNQGSVADADVAQVIYAKKGMGCQQTREFTTTGDTHTNTTVDNLPASDVENMAVGQAVSGAGIFAGSTIDSIDSPTSITLSHATTATAAGVTLTVTPVTPSGSTLKSYSITRPAGNVFTAWWFTAAAEDLYISFTINPINGVDTFNTTVLADALAAALTYKLNQSAFVGQIIAAMNLIAPNGYLTNIFVGTVASPSDQQVAPTDLQNYFSVIAGNIVIST
ncbi:MAG: baseplate J/gp47 family protein [Elusimicrobia bacterium]|nr:baseplate J/gp47 family protein [Elusimicrobiota bacterium]